MAKPTLHDLVVVLNEIHELERRKRETNATSRAKQITANVKRAAETLGGTVSWENPGKTGTSHRKGNSFLFSVRPGRHKPEEDK